MTTGKASMHGDSTYSTKHNNRTYDKDKWNKDDHIDYNRTNLNVTLVEKNLFEVFKEKFAEPLEDFNLKNEKKHKDRLKGLSYDKYKALVKAVGQEQATEIRKEKAVEQYYKENKGSVKEFVIQMGDHENYNEMVKEVGQARADANHKQYLTSVYEKFQKENPNLLIFGAYIHMDEVGGGTPHLHLDVLPVAESKQGLTQKVSMDGALKSEGYVQESKKYSETTYKQFLRNTRENTVEELAKKYMTVLPSEPTVKGEWHKTTAQYKAELEKKKFVETILDKFKNGKPTIENAEKIIKHIDDIRQVFETEKKDFKIALEKKSKSLDKREKTIENKKDEYKAELGAEIEKLNERERLMNIREAVLNRQQLAIDDEVSSKVKKQLESDREHYSAMLEIARDIADNCDYKEIMSRSSAFADSLQNVINLDNSINQVEQGQSEQKKTQKIKKTQIER